jgi:ornithine carbamoyltransferase
VPGPDRPGANRRDESRTGPRRHLLSIRDLSDADVRQLAERGAWYANGVPRGHRPLAGRVVGSYFRATSTRTRTAFASAALRLGAGHVAYGPGDLQLNTGESVEDTAQVFARMLDALVVRTAGDPAEIRALAGQHAMAVINAMSADEHPTQALADLTTLLRHFGRITGLRILYVGEGNNTAAALALALSRFPGVELCLSCPPGYGMQPEIISEAQAQAGRLGASIVECHHMRAAMRDADVVYTTRWETTGTTKPDPDWKRAFVPFRVDADLMRQHPRAVFMHDLPAHRGTEVTGAVLDGPSSIAFDQAENKMHSAKAVLEWCLVPECH